MGQVLLPSRKDVAIAIVMRNSKLGSGKGVFSEESVSRDSRNLEVLEILEKPQTVEQQIKNFDILEILEISPERTPLSQ